jgi:hypothetical protein
MFDLAQRLVEQFCHDRNIAYYPSFPPWHGWCQARRGWPGQAHS